MKGKLVKKDKIWYVMRVEEGDWETHYPLNPYDIKQIEEDGKVFDNIESRIAAWPDVEFIAEIFWETGIEEPFYVATLISDDNKISDGAFENVEEMIKHSDEVWSDPIPEITDDEIRKEALSFAYEGDYDGANGVLWNGFISGATWYREQLKQRNGS
jgi:hypothetical protein